MELTSILFRVFNTHRIVKRCVFDFSLSTITFFFFSKEAAVVLSGLKRKESFLGVIMSKKSKSKREVKETEMKNARGGRIVKK